MVHIDCESDVWLVYTHTKGFCGHHQILSVVIEQLHITRWIVASNKGAYLQEIFV